MKNRCRPTGVVAIAASIACLGIVAPTRAVEVLIPSYFYPGGAGNAWPQLNAAAGRVGVTAILNPGSGPGAALDLNYKSAVESLRASGGRVIGYVSTAYAARPIADVKADILKYRNLYPINGIFLDEMTNSTNTASLAYYREVYAYIKSIDPDYRVTGNPGTNTQPAYFGPPTADTIVTFESNAGYAGSTPSSWTTAYATRRFSHLPYQIATAAAMTSAVNAAVAKRAGYLYVTDDGPDGNPWDRLPTYWAAELDAIRAVTPTWSRAGSGDWNAGANWTTPAVPNGVGVEALLFNAIDTAETIYTNADVTLGVLAFNNASRYVVAGAGTLTLDATVESALIDVRRGHHTINLPLTLRDPTTVFVASGSSLTIADPLAIGAGASMAKTGTGTLAITSLVSDATVTVSAGRMSIEGDAAMQSLDLAAGASVELVGHSSLAIARGDVAEVRVALSRARADGDWSGAGITSAATDARHGIGYAASADGELLVRVALNGDANLDGNVDFADLWRLADNFRAGDDVTWGSGDFDYNGIADDQDLALLRSNYLGSDEQFSADWRLAQSLVPEPVTAALAAAASMLVVRRRRR